MKKLLTLAAATTLVAASLGAQAQVTINGTLGAGEVGTATAGNYVSLGQYPYAHGFEEGLLAFYAANTSTKVDMFVAGTLQPYSKGNNTFQLFIGLAGTTTTASIPAGVTLPLPTTTGGTTSTTSFGKFAGKLDQAVSYGLAIRTNGTAGTATTAGPYQVEAVAYRTVSAASGTTAAVYAAADTVLSATASPLLDNGTVLTLPTLTTGRFKAFSGARMAYKNTTDGLLTSNVGYVAPVTTATATPGTTYGTAVGTTGWEIELSRTALGLATGNPTLNLFVQQNNNDGSYVSSDYIPNAAFNSGANLAANPDYTAISGTQSATFALATVALAARAADAAAVALSVYPNPVSGSSTVTYQVTDQASHVNIALTDLMGRTVRVLENSVKQIGSQSTTVSNGAVAAGTYLMRVQVGDKVSTSKVAIL